MRLRNTLQGQWWSQLFPSPCFTTPGARLNPPGVRACTAGEHARIVEIQITTVDNEFGAENRTKSGERIRFGLVVQEV